MDVNKLTVNHLNVNRLYNKIESLKIELSKPQNGIHILGLSETCLDDRMDDEHMFIQKYKLIRRDKQKDKHKGLAAYIHDSISKYTKRRTDLENNEIECLWLEVKFNTTTPLLVCFIYRNPREPVQWIDQFESMIDNIPDKNQTNQQ